MKKPKPGSKDYDRRYLKWWWKQDRKQRNEWTFLELFKSIFQRGKK